MTFVILFGSRGDGALCAGASAPGEFVAEARLRVGAGVEGGMAGVDMAMRDDLVPYTLTKTPLAIMTIPQRKFMTWFLLPQVTVGNR